MMTVTPDLFNHQLPLPDSALSVQERTLIGFEQRYRRLSQRLWLIRHPDQLEAWSNRQYRRVATICGLVARQHPFLIFAGDSGTGKTATATCLANRLAREEATADTTLYLLSTRVRGQGRVGEIGTLLTDAFATVTKGAGKSRTAVLIIDEGDSLAASRAHEQSHHEDKVAVNTLLQLIDQAREAQGRIVMILCTNRLAALDPAVMRRAALIETFTRPTADERRDLFSQDLGDLGFDSSAIEQLILATDAHGASRVAWSYSDLRLRLYPEALSRAVALGHPLDLHHFVTAAGTLAPTPEMEG